MYYITLAYIYMFNILKHATPDVTSYDMIENINNVISFNK